MRKILINILVTVYVLGLFSVLGQNSAGKGTLSGIVISVADGSLLVNAKVTVLPGEMTVGSNLDGIHRR